MHKLNIVDLRNIIKKPIERNIKSLGLDVSTRTGWCLITTNTKTLNLDYGFIKVDTKDLYSKLDKYIEYFGDLIKSDYRVIIEDSYLKFNVVTLKLLARLEAIAYVIAKNKKVKETPQFIYASTARKNLGINGICQKEEVAKWIKKNLNIKLEDEDASDCFDSKTEVLTKQGWKYFKDLDKTDLVLSLNIENDVAEYRPIKRIICSKYNGVMYEYNYKHINFLVTPNHKLLIRTTNKPNVLHTKIDISKVKRDKYGRFINSSKLYGRTGKNWKFHFQKVKDINNTYWWMKRTFKWIGIKPNKYILPKLEIISKNHPNNAKRIYIEKKFNIKDWLTLIGWFISEGSVKKCRNNINGISIHQSLKNIKNREEIITIINKLKYDAKIYKKCIDINNPQLARHLIKICYTHKDKHTFFYKKVPDFIKELSPNLISVFLNAYRKGDGWICHKSNFYSTSSPWLKEDIQELIFKTGKQCSIRKRKSSEFKWVEDHFVQSKHINYVIEELKRDDAILFKDNLKKSKYIGNIYCVETQPFHTVFVRRNNKCHWSGNSVVLAINGVIK